MKYKPGDVVTIRPDLEAGVYYHMIPSLGANSGIVTTQWMCSLGGQAVTIGSVSKTGDSYRLVGLPCYWTDCMFVNHEQDEYYHKAEVDTGNDPVSFLFGA